MLGQVLSALTVHAGALGEHLAAHAVLARQELGLALRIWQRRLLLQLVAVHCAVMACMLAGMALLLRDFLPAAQTSWVLFVVPLVPALLAIGAWCMASTQRPGPALDNLLAQWQADLQLLRARAP